MTRKDFIALCESSEREIDGEPVTLHLGVHRDGLERAVCLWGCWAGGLVRRELYRPSPGRQGRDCYESADRRCGEELARFQRWLAEHRFPAVGEGA